MRDHHIPPTACLACGRIHDGAMGIDDEKRPSSGDIAICVYCGHIQAYGNDLQLRELTREEQISIAGDKSILKAQRAIAQAKADYEKEHKP
jgi:hypothetical protein